MSINYKGGDILGKIRWGIIGTGNIANKFAKAVKNVKGAELAAVGSRTGESAKLFAEKYNIPRYFSSYEELCAFDGIDAVYVATPHSLHAPCAAMCIKAKKHVLCEKPVTVNEKELSELIALAEENGVFLMEAMWTRFLPAIRELKKMVEGGIIGEVRAVRADFCYNASDEKTHHVFNPEYGGGSLLDVGIYPLNFASVFLGAEPEKMSCMCEVVNGVDEQCYILLSYSKGAIASLSSALTVEKPSDGYIYGSHGYIYVPEFYTAQKFTVFANGKAPEVYKYPYAGNGFEEEIEECVSCIVNGKLQSDIMPLCESLKIMKIMDSVRRREGIVYPADENK